MPDYRATLLSADLPLTFLVPRSRRERRVRPIWLLVVFAWGMFFGALLWAILMGDI